MEEAPIYDKGVILSAMRSLVRYNGRLAYKLEGNSNV